MASESVENYLKAIYRLSGREQELVSTDAIAERLNTKASSVTDMLKKLAGKKLLEYTPYKGGKLTAEGEKLAIHTLRKHRLWEVFLLEKLHFTWDQVHDIAEQMEHIDSLELVNRLDDFLGNPKRDPHGDPIPDRDGNVKSHADLKVSDLIREQEAIVVGLKESSSEFLKMMESKGLRIGSRIQLRAKNEWDQSATIMCNENAIELGLEATNNIYVEVL